MTILGFLVLLWYAWETRKLRIIADSQKDLEILPIPFIFFNAGTGSNNFLMIKNLGNGSALSTQIEPYKINGKTLSFSIGYFGTPRDFSGDLLKPQTEDPKRIFITYNNEEANEMFYQYFAADGKSMTEKGRELTITFRDIQNNIYEIKENFSKNGLTITQLPKRINDSKIKKLNRCLRDFFYEQF